MQKELQLEGKSESEQLEFLREKAKKFEECTKALIGLLIERSEQRAKNIKKHLEAKYSDFIEAIEFRQGEYKEYKKDDSDERGVDFKFKDSDIIGLIWANHEYYEKNYSYSIWISRENQKKFMKGVYPDFYHKNKFPHCENPIEKEREFLAFVDDVFEKIKKHFKENK